jgi:hypothetical protein
MSAAGEVPEMIVPTWDVLQTISIAQSEITATTRLSWTKVAFIILPSISRELSNVPTIAFKEDDMPKSHLRLKRSPLLRIVAAVLPNHGKLPDGMLCIWQKSWKPFTKNPRHPCLDKATKQLFPTIVTCAIGEKSIPMRRIS